MSLTLERLAKTTQMTLEELDNVGVPLTCDKGHSDVRYTPTNTEILVECVACGYNDVCFPKTRLSLHQ